MAHVKYYSNCYKLYEEYKYIDLYLKYSNILISALFRKKRPDREFTNLRAYLLMYYKHVQSFQLLMHILHRSYHSNHKLSEGPPLHTLSDKPGIKTIYQNHQNQ